MNTFILIVIACCLFAIACSINSIVDNLRDINNTLLYILQELKRL